MLKLFNSYLIINKFNNERVINMYMQIVFNKLCYFVLVVYMNYDYFKFLKCDCLLFYRYKLKYKIKITFDMPKNQCSICDSESFENINGFYYCIICNTQAQVKTLRNLFFYIPSILLRLF